MSASTGQIPSPSTYHGPRTPERPRARPAEAARMDGWSAARARFTGDGKGLHALVLYCKLVEGMVEGRFFLRILPDPLAGGTST